MGAVEDDRKGVEVEVGRLEEVGRGGSLRRYMSEVGVILLTFALCAC